MTFRIFTLFPGLFDAFFSESLMRRAIENGIIDAAAVNIRDHSTDRHRKVDSRPFGGGPGMVLEVGPIYRAIADSARKSAVPPAKRRIILLSPRGKPFTAARARALSSRYREIYFICGRYEGVDERVAKYVADESCSVGPYVLNGGEIAAMTVMEAVSRFVPGFLGKKSSLEEEKGSYPVYARPAAFAPDARNARLFRRQKTPKTWNVPPVLRSGDHAAIDRSRGLSPSSQPPSRSSAGRSRAGGARVRR